MTTLLGALLAAGALAGCEPEHVAVDRHGELPDLPGGLVVADFNDDGKDEVLVGSQVQNQGVSLLVEDDRRRFQLERPDVQVVHSDQMVTIDANGDDLPDVLAAPDRANGDFFEPITVLENRGDGQFRAHEHDAQDLYGLWGSLGVESVTALAETKARGPWGGMQLVAIGASLVLPDGDGQPAYHGAVAVFPVENNRLTDAIAIQDGTHSTAHVTALAFGDLTQDGRPDLVVGRVDGEITVYVGDEAPGTFKPAQLVANDAGRGPIKALAIGDVGVMDAPSGIPPGVDPDGRPDVLLLGEGGKSMEVIPAFTRATGELDFGVPRKIFPEWSGNWAELATVAVDPGGAARWLAAGNRFDPHVYWGNRSGADRVALPRPCDLVDAQPIRTDVPDSPYGVVYTCRDSRTAVVWMPGRQRLEAPEQVEFGSVPANLGTTGRNITLQAPGRFRIAKAWLAGADAGEFGVNVVTRNCTDSCLVGVSFSPRSEGEKSARLVLQTSAYPRVLEIPLEGVATEGPAPGFAAPAEIELGKIRIGESESAELELENPGTAPMRISGFELLGRDAAAFEVEPGNCLLGAIEPGRGCTASVSAAPTGRDTVFARLRVETDPSNLSREVVLSAKGTVAQLALTTQAPKRARVLRRGRKAQPIRLTLRNGGDASAREVRLSLRLPRGIKLKAPKARKRGGAVTLEIGELAPGAQKVVRLRLAARKRAARRGGKLRIRLLSADLPKPRSSAVRLRVRGAATASGRR